MKREQYFIICFMAISVFTVLYLFDGFTTQMGLEKGHIEQNPIIRFTIDNTGYAGMYIMKFIVVVILFLGIKKNYLIFLKTNKQIILWMYISVLYFLCGLMSYVVASNIMVLANGL